MADARDKDRGQRNQEESIRPRSEVNQLVVVDLGQQEHGSHPPGDPVDLLGVEADVLGVQGGGINLQHRNRAEHEHDEQESPVEVAEAQEAAHQGSLLGRPMGTAVNRMGSPAGSLDCWLASTWAVCAVSIKKCPA